MRKKFYITTPIYYVNDKPHIGHAYTTIAADLIARFKRLDGYDVKFLTGTDEHGQKVERSALKSGKMPQAFVDEISQNFRRLCGTLECSEDDFIRTTEARHTQAVQHLWRRLQDKGYIYRGVYEGWYSLQDEAYYGENELIEGKAPTGAPVEWVAEPSFFFRLSAFQKPLLEFYARSPDFIAPETRRNEVIRFVEGGLKDLSISRATLKWGVPVPEGEGQVVYVWLDALTNYITAIGYPHCDASFQNYWQNVIHLVGKDILKFHAIYWPAFLLAADLSPPKRLFAHGWWTHEGKKISKSLGNTIDPFQLVENFGIDAVRYFLMREVPFGQDGDFSEKALRARMKSDLSNNLGNLVQRVLAFISKYTGHKVPPQGTLLLQDLQILDKSRGLLPWLRQAIDQQALHKYPDLIWSVISDANRYIDQEKPWLLRKEDTQRMQTVLHVLCRILCDIGCYLQPLLPLTAEKLLNQLNIAPHARSFSRPLLEEEHILGEIFPLFPRHEED